MVCACVCACVCVLCARARACVCHACAMCPTNVPMCTCICTWQVQLVLCGARAVRQDGGVIGDLGTQTMAIVAHHHVERVEVPFWEGRSSQPLPSGAGTAGSGLRATL